MQKSSRSFNTFLSLIIIGVLISGCIAKKSIPVKTTESHPGTKAPAADKSSSAIYTLEARFKNINRLNIRASVDINMPDLNQEVNSQIRWIRDSVFWMNFTILGIEGARLLITKDSFFMVDRINKNYVAENLKKMSVKYNLPISFHNLQNILLGNPVFLSSAQIQVDRIGITNHFVQEDANWKAEYFTDTINSQLNKMMAKQKTADAFIAQNLQNYKPVKKYSDFSFDRLIEFNSKASGKASIKLEIKELEVNTSKEIKFSIPSSYERM